MQDRKSSIRLALVAIAIFALAAGLTAIYVISDGAGNVETAQCGQARAKTAAIAPHATGEVAAFQVADNPVAIDGLTFRDGDGAAKSIADWRGRTVLLNLWATWCAPCRREMPALDALEKQMGGDTFAVVPVSVDLGDDAKPKNFFAETGIEALPFYHDGTMDIFNTLKKKGLAFGMPTTLLLDAQGCLLGSINGPAEWASDDAKALIGAAIGG